MSLYFFICKKIPLAHYHPNRGLRRWLSDKESTCNAGGTKDEGSIPGLGGSPGARKWQPTPVFLPGKSHGQRSLEGYSIWGRKESDPTEHTGTHLNHLMRLWSRVQILPLKYLAQCLVHYRSTVSGNYHCPFLPPIQDEKIQELQTKTLKLFVYPKFLYR